jgi:hypothetical protein
VIFIKDNEAFLKQYEIMVGTTQNVTAWRQTANTFYLTLNTAILGLVLYTLPYSALLVKLGLSVLGVLFSVLWYYSLDYYRKLNVAKFGVIYLMEKKLPIKMFKLEYKGNKKEKIIGYENTIIKEISKLEKILPLLFLVAYLAVIALVMYALIQPLL